MWYTRPLPRFFDSLPARSARTSAVSVPIPAPSGPVSPSAPEFTGSSWKMPVMVIAGTPLSSVTPRMEIGTILWFGGQITKGVATAAEQFGGRLVTSVTTIVALFVSLAVPSETEKVTGYEPASVKVGVHEKAPVDVLKDAPAGSPTALKVSGSLSASVAVTVKYGPVSVEPSAIVGVAVESVSAGARFVLVTVIVALFVSLAVPSETEKVTGYEPAS